MVDLQLSQPEWKVKYDLTKNLNLTLLLCRPLPSHNAGKSFMKSNFRILSGALHNLFKMFSAKLYSKPYSVYSRINHLIQITLCIFLNDSGLRWMNCQCLPITYPRMICFDFKTVCYKAKHLEHAGISL